MKQSTTTQVIKYQTSNEDIFFIGTRDDEEYYQEDGKTTGWCFMGLRPDTEENLREFAKDTDINEYCTIPQFLEKYIDYDAFAEDMEEDWEARHDVQATRVNEYGEILYLGFGSGTSADHYFKKNDINTYDDYCNHFDCVGLSKKEFAQYLNKYVNIK